jgi:hypothetical protein
MDSSHLEVRAKRREIATRQSVPKLLRELTLLGQAEVGIVTHEYGQRPASPVLEFIKKWL